MAVQIGAHLEIDYKQRKYEQLGFTWCQISAHPRRVQRGPTCSPVWAVNWGGFIPWPPLDDRQGGGDRAAALDTRRARGVLADGHARRHGGAAGIGGSGETGETKPSRTLLSAGWL